MTKSPEEILAEWIALREQRRKEYQEVKSWYGRPENVPAAILTEQRENELLINKKIAKLQVQIDNKRGGQS